MIASDPFAGSDSAATLIVRPLRVSVPALAFTKPGTLLVVLGAVHPVGMVSVTTPLVVDAPAGGA